MLLSSASEGQELMVIGISRSLAAHPRQRLLSFGLTPSRKITVTKKYKFFGLGSSLPTMLISTDWDSLAIRGCITKHVIVKEI